MMLVQTAVARASDPVPNSSLELRLRMMGTHLGLNELVTDSDGPIDDCIQCKPPRSDLVEGLTALVGIFA